MQPLDWFMTRETIAQKLERRPRKRPGFKTPLEGYYES
jgi:hypothetical protein